MKYVLYYRVFIDGYWDDWSEVGKLDNYEDLTQFLSNNMRDDVRLKIARNVEYKVGVVDAKNELD